MAVGAEIILSIDLCALALVQLAILLSIQFIKRKNNTSHAMPDITCNSLTRGDELPSQVCWTELDAGRESWIQLRANRSTRSQHDQSSVQPSKKHGTLQTLHPVPNSSMGDGIYPLPSHDLITTCVSGTRAANEKREQCTSGDSNSRDMETLILPTWSQTSFSQPSRSTIYLLSLFLIIVSATTGALLFCSQFPAPEEGSNPPRTYKGPIQDQGPKPSSDSVPVIMAAIYIYCLAGGFLYYLNIRSRSEQSILSGVLMIATVIGFICGLSFPEIVFRLLPWVYISGVVLAGYSGNLEVS